MPDDELSNYERTILRDALLKRAAAGDLRAMEALGKYAERIRVEEAEKRRLWEATRLEGCTCHYNDTNLDCRWHGDAC